MSAVVNPTTPGRNINVLRYISAGLFLLTALLSMFNGQLYPVSDFFDLFSFAFELGGIALFSLIHYLLVCLALPLGSIALGVTGLLAKTGKVWVFGVVGFFMVTVPLSWLFQLFIANEYFRFTPTAGNGFLDWIIFLGLLSATVVGFVSTFVKRKPAVASMSPSVTPAAPLQTGTQSPSSMSNNLPVFAVIGAVFVPLAGIVLGHISLAQMKRGQISSNNRILAVLALVIGYLFTLFYIAVFVIYVLIIFFAYSTGYSY
jgi:hypothetical protein